MLLYNMVARDVHIGVHFDVDAGTAVTRVRDIGGRRRKRTG